MTAAPPMVCAICTHRLATITTRDDHGKLHTDYCHHEPTNHRPVPVPPGIIDDTALCDFCGTPHPTWALPVAGFTLHAAGGTPGRRSTGDWHACDTCAALIRRGDWPLMAHRAVACANARQRHKPHPARDGRAAASLNRFWENVRDHTTGPLRPLTAEQEATP